MDFKIFISAGFMAVIYTKVFRLISLSSSAAASGLKEIIKWYVSEEVIESGQVCSELN